MRTVTTAPLRRLAALTLLCAALSLLPACGSVSTRPEIAPTPPRVDCQKPATPPLDAPPDGWVRCELTACWLTEKGANYVLGLFGVIELERTLRGMEHACLDDHEQRGIITQ